MNRNANTIFGFVAAAVLILSGCINNVDTETGGNSNVPDGKCSLTVDSGFSARAAFPQSLAADMVYAAEISYSSSGAKKWLGADSLENSPAVLRNSLSASGEIRFVFCAPEESAEYTITVFACPAGTSVGSAADVENAAAASGQAEFSLKAGQKALETPVKVSLSPTSNVSGTGSVKLPLFFASALGIAAAEVNVTKDGEPDSSENNYRFKMEVSGSGATLSAENAPAGTYLAIMKFYNSTTVSSSTEVAVNSAVQQVCVYSGMTTDCWFIGGKKHGTTAADGTFKPSALELTKYDFTELYVCGTDGGGESDGKRSFYVSSNFASSVPDGNDTTGDGSMAKPFATVQKAVDTIAAFGDTSKKYTIYVDGTVEPLYADTDLSDETFISIKGTTASNLDLTIKGLSAGAKAVLNAKQKDRNYGRVLTSKNTSLTLENLKITGGKVNGLGGGIYIESGNLTLKKCVVTKNEASNGGGGIHFDGENLIVENSEISENKGDSGGICVAASSAKTKIKDSNIIKNSARSGGGGLDLVGESTIEDCNITDNKAEFSTGGGGGLILAFNNKSCKIIKSVIENNIAGENGGGIYINGGTLSLESGTAINSNKAKNGGGIYINAGEAGLSDCTISSNEAFEDGGAIYASCEHSTITVNIGEKDDSDDVLIEKNNAERGGAFYGADKARFVMNAGKVSGNYSTRTDEDGGGGAMFLSGGTSNYSTFTMNGGEISGNMAKSGGAGGAVHIDDGSGGMAAFIMTGGLLSGNKTTDENGNDSKLGGAIYVKNGGQIKLGGSAVIAVENDGNDIWLATGKTITVTDRLTPGNNAVAGNPKYTARITPENYNVGTTIIQGESELDSSSCAKFLVTDDTDGHRYEIEYASSDKKGNLARINNIIIEGKEYEKTGFKTVIDTTTTITGDGSSEVFKSGRTVTLSPYSIGKYEVTQELYEAVMGENPSKFQGNLKPPADGETQERRPVEGIYWYHAILFCNKLSIKMGLDKCYIITQSDGSEIDYDNIDLSNNNIKAVAPNWQISYKFENNGYRLPTEAEWEFAARGGDQNAIDWNYKYAGSDDIEEVAWYNEDGVRSTKKTHEVGRKKANRLGLYDMSGNCWEFCSDRSSSVSGDGTDPVASGTGGMRRGGGLYDIEKFINILNKFNRSPQSESDLTTWDYDDNGLRLARSGFPRAN